jgi:hypothetical protein
MANGEMDFPLSKGLVFVFETTVMGKKTSKRLTSRCPALLPQLWQVIVQPSSCRSENRKISWLQFIEQL